MSATVTRPAAARAMPRVCRHCGAPLADEKARAAGFCCAGCAYVFRLVHEHGLDGYYRIKDEVTVPADAAVFQPRDHTWLEEAQQAAEQAAGAGSPVLTLDVQGISCAGCVWLIERVFRQQPGARDIVVSFPRRSSPASCRPSATSRGPPAPCPPSRRPAGCCGGSASARRSR